MFIDASNAVIDLKTIPRSDSEWGDTNLIWKRNDIWAHSLTPTYSIIFDWVSPNVVLEEKENWPLGAVDKSVEVWENGGVYIKCSDDGYRCIVIPDGGSMIEALDRLGIRSVMW